MRHRIAVIPGDGIGNEVVPEGMRVLEAAARRFGFELEWKEFDWSCEVYAKTGRMMPEDGLEQLRAFEAIFLGAVGFPGVPDHVSLWGLLIPIRRGFHQYINLRPVRLLKGVRSPLAGRGPGRHRHAGRAREQRGRVLGDRRSPLPRLTGRAGHAAGGVHQEGLRPRHALRLRARDATAPAPRDLGHQEQRHHPQHAVLGRALRRHRPGIPDGEDRSVPHRHPDRPLRPAPRLVRRGRGVESLRRHPLGSRSGHRGLDRHRARRKHQPREGLPVDVRARARLGSRTLPARASPIPSPRSGPAP